MSTTRYTDGQRHLPDMPDGLRVPQTHPHAPLTPERVQELFEQRKKMLLSLKGNIVLSWYDAIAEKIRYENESLTYILNVEARTADVQKKLNKVLRSEYFVRKFLDTNLF